MGKSEVLDSAREELLRGVRGMLGRRLRITSKIQEPAIVLGTLDQVSSLVPALPRQKTLRSDGFWLVARKVSEGYVPLEVVPPPTASGGRAIECPPPLKSCAAVFHFQDRGGWYDVDVQYFDQNNGTSRFRILVDDQLVDEWSAGDVLPRAKIRHPLRGVRFTV